MAGNPKSRREEPLLFGLGLAVSLIIVTAVVASAFFDVTIAGSPPMRYVLTFFFFWAGLHIVQQHAFVHAALPRLAPRAKRWDVVEVAVMLLAMYPASLFRMSMVDTTDASMRFEKAQDPANAELAVHLFVDLLQKYCPTAQPAGPLLDPAGFAYEPKRIVLRRARLAQKLGIELPDDKVAAILGSLELGVVVTAAGFEVSVP